MENCHKNVKQPLVHLNMKSNPLIVIRDSREKENNGFHFPNMIIGKLDAGDYSIKGLENVISIERKSGVDEIFSNLGAKKNKERFYRELELLKTYKYKYIVIEGTVAQMLYGSRFSKIDPLYIMRLLNEIELTYGIPIKFIEKGDAAHRYVGMLLESIASKEFGCKFRLEEVIA